jgi:hypothetical protein
LLLGAWAPPSFSSTPSSTLLCIHLQMLTCNLYIHL